MRQVWAIAMMRDEEDVARQVVEHIAQEGVDGIIVADNLSTDGTRDALASASVDCPLIVTDDPDPGYYQSGKMTHLAAMAARNGADWIVPFDADELWMAHSDRLAVVLRRLDPAVTVAEARLLNHYCTDLDDLADPNPFTRIRWRSPHDNPLPKIAFRWRPDARIDQGNHGVTWDGPTIVHRGELLVHHFPIRSGEHMVRKARNGAAAYQATDLPEHEGAHWRGWGRILEESGPDAILDVFSEHYFYAADSGLVTEDPAPWKRWR